MAHASLPVDVQETDLAVFFAAFALALASRREVVLATAGDLHAAQAAVQLRRHCLREDARGLPRVLELVLQRVPAAVDLEAGGHISSEACREVEARKERNGRAGFLHQELLLSLDRHLRVATPRACQIAHLEVTALLPCFGHDAPNVEVGHSRCRVQHSRNPLLQRRLGGGPLRAAEAQELVAGVLPAPTKGVAEVVRRPQWELRDGREALLHLGVRPDEAVAGVCEALVGSGLVGLQRCKEDEECKGGGAVAAAGDQAGADAHGLGLLLGQVQLQAKYVEQAAPILVLHDVDDVEEPVLIVGRVLRQGQDVLPRCGPGVRVDERQRGHMLVREEGGQPSMAAVPVCRQAVVLLAPHLLPRLLKKKFEVGKRRLAFQGVPRRRIQRRGSDNLAHARFGGVAPQPRGRDPALLERPRPGLRRPASEQHRQALARPAVRHPRLR
mmetsp:Transcript_2978/g.8435  ORF Transcript_2978/g.8435 Transcript_2978/m.8435 type:complete len:442 (+) Transcript_2978:571-1896(+)